MYPYIEFQVGDRKCSCDMCTHLEVPVDLEPCRSCLEGMWTQHCFYGKHAAGFQKRAAVGPGEKFHELKIKPEFFCHVNDNDKNFELRKDDRGFEIGDLIVLREWDGKSYTGRFTVRRINYILRNASEYGLIPGFCILGTTQAG